MSRICTNTGDSGKLRLYELDHGSKMRLLETHLHTSNGLAMEPGKREEKQLKETQTIQQDKPPIENLPRTAGVAEGEDIKSLRQTNRRKGSMARQALVEMKGNTGAYNNTRENSCLKTPAGH